MTLLFRILYTIILLLLFTSCNDEDAFDCFKTTGELIELEVAAEPFEKIEISDAMDVFLSNGTQEKIILKGGKNLLPKVRIIFEDGTIKIENRNRCNWTRDYEQIQIYITGPLIKEITHYGFGKIITQDTLSSESLRVNCQGFSGDIDMTLDVSTLVFVSNGVSFARISGSVSNFWMGHYFNEGMFDGENLEALNVSVDHKGYGRIRVNVIHSLTGEISQNGTLEYITDTASVDVEVLGEGKLIRINSNP